MYVYSLLYCELSSTTFHQMFSVSERLQLSYYRFFSDTTALREDENGCGRRIRDRFEEPRIVFVTENKASEKPDHVCCG